jgi:hypothetical protein
MSCVINNTVYILVHVIIIHLSIYIYIYSDYR